MGITDKYFSKNKGKLLQYYRVRKWLFDAYNQYSKL